MMTSQQIFRRVNGVKNMSYEELCNHFESEIEMYKQWITEDGDIEHHHIHFLEYDISKWLKRKYPNPRTRKIYNKACSLRELL
jgi:hypothetical protein